MAMLAVFGQQRRADLEQPSKLAKKRSIFSSAVNKAEEDYIYGALEPLYDSLPFRQKAYVTERLLGNGQNGLG